MLFLIYFLLLISWNSCFGLDLFCRNLKGKKVDWFVAYKLPDLPSTNKGTSFLYADSKNPSKWTLSDLPITDPQNAIGKTFSQLWEAKKNPEIFYAIYNDDDPSSNKSGSSRAHMKGAMAFDDFTGFWITHSVPRLIDLSKRQYSYPDSGLKYGQTFFCGSYSVTALTEIGKHLEFAQPSISRSKIPSSFAKLFPALSRAIEKKRLSSKSSDYTVSQAIETLGGEKLKLFSKNKKFEKDLYSSFMVKELKTSLFVESWLNGASTDLPSFCSSAATAGNEKVYNLRSVNLDNGKYSFPSSKDHSKWAVSTNATQKVVCIGDINRQKSQNLRGGGAVCITNSQIGNLFRHSIDTIECCGKDGKIAKNCMIINKIFGILSLLFITTQSFEFDCRDINGQPVDWFVAYKLPILSDRSKHRSGLDFLYADSRKPDTWQVSSKQINDASSAIGKTFGQLWKAKNDQSIFYALYNDEHPNSNKSDSYRGHMKGVLLFDEFRGFWMIHSVPNFVDLSQPFYTYPTSGIRNGQSFLCVTFPISALSQIGSQLLFAQPSVYDYHLPDSYRKLYPDLVKAVEKKSMGKAETSFSSIKSIESLGGVNFMSFSKHKKYGKDLYGDLVAPELKSSFYVETWLNGPGDLLSYCNNSYKIYNLRSVKVDVDYAFSSSKDHSKWAVSDNGSLPYICIGDINRQKSQMSRGGGCLCLQNSLLWHLYRSSVDHVECCPTTNIFHLPSVHNSARRQPSNSVVSHFSCITITLLFGFIKLLMLI